jgi:hypothetical protein
MSLIFIGIDWRRACCRDCSGSAAVLIVPALVYFARMPIMMATGTARRAVAARPGRVDLPPIRQHRPASPAGRGLFFGAFKGHPAMSPQLLQRLFAVFLVLMAARMGEGQTPRAPRSR